jgi:hypothetical protein
MAVTTEQLGGLMMAHLSLAWLLLVAAAVFSAPLAVELI